VGRCHVYVRIHGVLTESVGMAGDDIAGADLHLTTPVVGDYRYPPRTIFVGDEGIRPLSLRTKLPRLPSPQQH
jgi:hypothetical protein